VSGHHHHGIDPALEASGQGVRALQLSLVALLLTACLQLVVTLVSGSVALLGDTLHNFADALTALPLWLAFSMGRRRPNRRFTYGYGRAEDLAGIVVVGAIAVSAAVAAWEAVLRIRHPHDVHHLPFVMAAAVIGMLGNELVAVYRIRVGRQIGSAALVADGLHARTDGLTSLAVLLGAIGVALGWRLADPIVGLAISVAILLVLVDAGRRVWERLMDAVDPSLVDQGRSLLSAVEGVEGVSDLRIRWIGHRLHAEARITVDRDLGVAEAHDISERAHHELLHHLPRLSGALVHADPCNHDGSDPHARTAHHFPEGR